jgi:hypothetical protein
MFVKRSHLYDLCTKCSPMAVEYGITDETMTYERTNGDPAMFPVTTDVAAQSLAQERIDALPFIQTGAYRKGYFNGLLFRGGVVAPEIHTEATERLINDPRMRDVFTAGDQQCYYWSAQAGSPEEKFVDNLHDNIVPEAVSQLYKHNGAVEFPIGWLVPVVSRLTGMHIAPDGPRIVQPWESTKLFVGAHERVTSRHDTARGLLFLRISPPQRNAPTYER